MSKQQELRSQRILIVVMAMIISIGSAAAVITVQIGGATRLGGLTRSRDKYSCYWDCDLVGCQIASDDDECAYDCEKICRVKYDYAARSGASESQPSDLSPKSAVLPTQEASSQAAGELPGAGTSVRLHLPRNASARNFAIWERCASDSSSGKLTEKPFNL